MSGKVLLTYVDEVEHYEVDATCDDFAKAGALSPFFALELAAYYAGELVTPWVVKCARRDVVKRGSKPPLPMKSVGRGLNFACTDGMYDAEQDGDKTLDISTYCRYFELVADLYELDPTLTTIKVPFTQDQIDLVVLGLLADEESTMFETSLDEVLPVLQFLRLKKSVYYLRYDCTESKNLELLRQIAFEMPPELKKRQARWARMVNDDGIWPIVDKLVRHGEQEQYGDSALVRLMADRPSALLAILCLYEDPSVDFVTTLLRTSNFEDKHSFVLSTGERQLVAEALVGVLCRTEDLASCRHLLVVLGGWEHGVSETSPVIHPFSTNLSMNYNQTKIATEHYDELIASRALIGRLMGDPSIRIVEEGEEDDS